MFYRVCVCVGIRYATYNHDGTMLAVGHKNGFITVIDTSDIRQGMEYHDGLIFFQKKVHKVHHTNQVCAQDCRINMYTKMPTHECCVHVCA